MGGPLFNNQDNSAKSDSAAAPNWRIREWFTDIDTKVHDNLFIYFTELQKFNKVINLVSAKTMLNADATHFADSINAALIVRKKLNNNKSLYDFGSGNGFPGLVYAMLYTDQKVILTDSDERKCEFLKHVVQQSGLKNVEVLNKQIELLSKDPIEQVISRGFSQIPKMLLTLRKMKPKDSLVFHMKGEEWALEISQIPIQLCSAWQPTLAGEYILPVTGARMFVVETLKLD